MPMHTIDLTYVGRGIHEELIAYAADQEGYFEDEGVHVALHDGTRWKTERLRTGATSGPGRALLSRLTDGIQWSVLTVNTHRPLFWFLGSGEVRSMDDLRGRRLAVHEAHTAPGCFARIVLRKHGLDPDRDVKCVVRAPGDYQTDLRRIRDGSIDAAYVGSTLAPEEIADEVGFSVLSWVGDHLQIPTVGIAVDPHTYHSTTRRCRLWSGATSEPSRQCRTTPFGRQLHRFVPRPADQRGSEATLRAQRRPVFHHQRSPRNSASPQ